MDKEVHKDFIKFCQPLFDGIDSELFDGVTMSYAQQIVSAIWEMALNYPNACIIILVKICGSKRENVACLLVISCSVSEYLPI